MKYNELCLKFITDDMKRDLLKASRLDDRAVADYARCCEFSKVMSELLSRRGRLVLLDWNPKIAPTATNFLLMAW